MDDKDFRQAMKLYRSAPVTHVAPETGSLAAPQKKDIAHREKARVWFPRQTPADSALQPEGGDEGRQPEEQPEETMQGAVTVYQEKKVAAYGRMEKVDEPEAMDAPDVPLADAMSADNPPCDVDYRVVSDGEVLQLGMEEEPVAAEEAPVADSPFENMIASVEAGLASMLAEGPPVADEGTTSEEDADDETAALLAGMSEEERAEIAGFDLSLLREDEPEADDSVAPEEALTAGLSKEELAEIAGFDPALLAEAPDETGQVPAAAEAKAVATEEKPAEDVSEAALDAAVQEDRPGEPVVPKADGSDVSAGDSEAKEALLTGAQDVSVSADMAMVPEVATAEEAMPVVGVAGISEEAVAAGDAGLPEAVAQDGQETVVEAAEEQPAMAAIDEAAAEDAALAGALEAAADGEAHVADGDFAGADEGMVEETAPAVGADDVTKQASDVRDAPEPDEAAIPAGEAVFGQKAEMAGLAEEDEHGAAETGKGDLLHGMPSDEAETLPDAEAVPAAIEEGEAQVVEAPLHDAGGDNPSETSAVGLFAERVEEESTAADAFAGAMASEGEATEAAAQTGPEASDSGMPASDREEGLPVETGATEADIPEEGAVLADMHGASEPEDAALETATAGDSASTEADAIATEEEPAAEAVEDVSEATLAAVQDDMPGAPVMPQASDSGMPASDREEGLPVEAGATEADIPEEGAVLADMQGASKPEDEAAEAAPAGEVFSGEAETLSVAGIAPERGEEEPTADDAFAGVTASEGEATEAVAQAGLETAVDEGITETGEEAVSVPEPTGNAVSTTVDAIATEDEPADGVAALAAVSEAAQGEQAAGVEEEIPGDAVMQEAGSDGVPAGDEEAASEPEAEKPAEAETGEKAEEAIMAGEGKTAEALLPEASMENPSEAGAAGFAVETVEAGETGLETAVDEGIAESGGEAVSVPEPGRETAAAEQTEEADAGISAGALPDPETALADGILLAEGEALPAAPVPDGMPAAPQGVIPEEEVFRDKMRNHQRNRMAFAEYKVAAAYAREGTDAAYQEAIKWYTRAAEKGHAVSRFNLGNIYYAGRGVEQDYAKAADWYELAARQGVARAQDNLGLMFFHGRGRPVEPEMAVYWFRQAAIQGYAPAQYKLAIHLEAGVGVESNRAEALYWYRKAASQGHGQAEKEAARLEEEGRR